MKKLLIATLVLGLAPVGVWAQQTAPPETNPVSNMVKLMLERSAKNMVGAAEEMPADKYSYSPTPEQITFGHLVVHVTNFNNLMCSKLSGTAAPDAPKLADTDAKDKLLPALKASYDFCAQAMSKVDDSNLGEQVSLFGDRKMSRAAAMLVFTSSFADHYGMAAMYLRMNKLVPPTAAQQRPEH
jgi:uncharacterized damage-inducible protein DinB